MNFGLIVIGDEILSGKRQDKHLSRVIELLAARGLSLSWARLVGDDPERITAVLRDALASGDAVFSCGGIGATPDDHTRACAAQASGRTLVLHEQARLLILERMLEMAQAKGQPFEPERPDNLQRLQMGVFPQGCTLVHNPYNKIPGFTLEGQGGGAVHFLPGFPVMAWPMIEALLDTRWAHCHQALAVRERAMIVRSAMESALTPLMQEVEAQFPGIKVFSLPSVDDPQWGPHIELGVKPAHAQAQARLNPAYAQLQAGVVQLGFEIGTEWVR
jgi:molybdopterin-biosynthesis enzyme MoeA-like protein